MDSLTFARDVWREFNLNDSQGAGMTLIVNGEIAKQYGNLTNTDDLKNMGESIVFYQATKAKK